MVVLHLILQGYEMKTGFMHYANWCKLLLSHQKLAYAIIFSGCIEYFPKRIIRSCKLQPVLFFCSIQLFDVGSHLVFIKKRLYCYPSFGFIEQRFQWYRCDSHWKNAKSYTINAPSQLISMKGLIIKYLEIFLFRNYRDIFLFDA